MYTIKHNGRMLFDPTNDEYSVEAPIVSREANKLATLDFTIYPNNPEFDLIQDHTSVISVYLDGALMNEFRPAYRKNTFAGGVNWRCEEGAARLDDELHRPDYFKGTIAAYISRMVTQYNARVSASKAVHVGDILFNPDTVDTFINDDYEGFWEGLVSSLTETYGGYLIPRYEADGLYIDYMSDEDLPLGTQTIRFGENMADMFMDTDTDEMYTVLIPLGANVDVSNPQSGQARQRPLTIASVNGGNDYLEDAAGIALYGRREKTQRWQSITSASELKAKGIEYLADHAAKLKKTITLTAIDLHNLNVDVSAFQWMTRIPIYSEVHNIDTNYTATKMDTHLGNPEPLQLQMGEPKEVFTDRAPKNSVSRRGGGGGGGRAASQDDLDYWQMVVRKEEDLLWDSGLKEINESGIILDAESGVSLYNLKDIILGNGVIAGLKGYIDVNAENITQEVTRATTAEGTLSGRIDVQAGKITQIVSAVGSNGQVTAASIVLAINNSASSVTISADKILLSGNVSLDSKISGIDAYFSGSSTISKLLTNRIDAGIVNVLAEGALQVSSAASFTMGDHAVSWKSKSVVTSVTIPSTGLSDKKYFVYSDKIVPSAISDLHTTQGYVVKSHSGGSGPSTSTIYYLGRN